MSKVAAIAAGVILIVPLIFAGYEAKRVSDAQAETARVKATFANYRAQADSNAAISAQQYTREADRVAGEQRKVLDDRDAKIQTLEAARARSDAAAGGLRNRLAAVTAAGHQAAADPGASPACQAAASASAMLSDLLGRCSDRRRELAQYADSTRVAAESCVGLYEALTPPNDANH